jgi:GTP-binding protein
MTLEEALAYMGDDEIAELTPGSIRLRKVVLDQAKRMGMDLVCWLDMEYDRSIP